MTTLLVPLIFLWLPAVIVGMLLLSAWALAVHLYHPFRQGGASPAPALGVQLKQQLRLRKVVIVGSCLAVALVSLLAVEETWLTHQRLRRSARASDRLVLRTGGNCHRRPNEEIILFESRNPSDLRDVVDRLSFSPDLSFVVCRCCGDMTFEFYRANALQVSFSLHHNDRIRIPGKGDRALSSASAAALVNWLAEVGAPQKLAKHKEALDKQKREEWDAMKAEVEAEAARLSSATNGNFAPPSETNAPPPADESAR